MRDARHQLAERDQLLRLPKLLGHAPFVGEVAHDGDHADGFPAGIANRAHHHRGGELAAILAAMQPLAGPHAAPLEHLAQRVLLALRLGTHGEPVDGHAEQLLVGVAVLARGRGVGEADAPVEREDEHRVIHRLERDGEHPLPRFLPALLGAEEHGVERERERIGQARERGDVALRERAAVGRRGTQDPQHASRRRQRHGELRGRALERECLTERHADPSARGDAAHGAILGRGTEREPVRARGAHDDLEQLIGRVHDVGRAERQPRDGGRRLRLLALASLVLERHGVHHGRACLTSDEHREVHRGLIVRVGVVRLRLEHAERAVAVDDRRAEDDGDLPAVGALVGDARPPRHVPPRDVRLASAVGDAGRSIAQRQPRERRVVELLAVAHDELGHEPRLLVVVAQEGEAGRVDHGRDGAVELAVDLRGRRRRGDRLLELRERGDLGDASLEVANEPGILDGDRRMRGKRFEQLGVVLVEGKAMGIGDEEGADRVAADGEGGAGTGAVHVIVLLEQSPDVAAQRPRRGGDPRCAILDDGQSRTARAEQLHRVAGDERVHALHLQRPIELLDDVGQMPGGARAALELDDPARIHGAVEGGGAPGLGRVQWRSKRGRAVRHASK